MDPEQFGNFIKQCRHSLCISQSELAEKLHVTAKAVSRWERGVGFPDIKLLQPLADALGITIVELMQSKRIETNLSKEDAAEILTDTVETLRRQEQLSRNRRWITFCGSMLITTAMMLLILVSQIYRMEPRWVKFAVYMIGMTGGNMGVRALQRVALPSVWCQGRRWILLCGSCLAGAGLLLYAVWRMAEGGLSWMSLLLLTFLGGFISIWASRLVSTTATVC